MKKIITIGIFTLLISTFSIAQNNHFRNGAEYCSQKHMHQAISTKSTMANLPHSFDVLNYQLYADVYNCYQSPYPGNFTAINTMTFVADSVISQIKLNAVSTSLGIDSVRMQAASFSHANDMLTINLDQTYLPGDTITVKIYYHHNDVNDGAFYTNGGFVFTDCEPEGARKWFPCYDSPSDKATVDVTARVPSNVKLASNGRLADSTLDGDVMIYHWISRDPVATYLVLLTSKVNYKLDIIQRPNPGGGTTPIRFYYNNGENISNPRQVMIPMMDYYSEQFGEHPFEKNGFATLNNEFVWGGMENQTLTSLCPGCWGEDLLAHEFAHQWFGDMITCATWADIFLNEGFATWTEAHWIEHTEGYAQYHSEMENNADYYKWGNPGWAISNPDWAINTPSTDVLFDYSITYMKGSCVMHMLRYVLGDNLFFSGMYNYANKPELKYHSAVISDFKNAMEETSGQDLDWFFNEWIYQPNHPEYQNTYNFVDLGSGQWKVNFTANQNQGLSANYFQMPIEIKIGFNQGADTLIRVMNTINHEHFEWIFNSEPVSLAFDPNDDILLKDGTTTVGISNPATKENTVLQCKPNPASGKTTVSYYVPAKANVKIRVYSITGSEMFTVCNNLQEQGNHQLSFNVSNMPSGIYFMKMDAGNTVKTTKLVIAK